MATVFDCPIQWLSDCLTVSAKPNRCDYEQLTPDEDNNNAPDSKKNGKNKSQHHRRFGSIDDDDNRNGSHDEDSGNIFD